MAVTYVLVKRGKPGDSLATKRWYAQAQINNEIAFDKLCEEASHSCSATKGDIMLGLDASIASMVRHLSEGECVALGEFGRFRMEVHNVKTKLDEEGESIPAAPVNKDDFTSTGNISGCRIVFTPGSALRSMCKTAKYRLVDGGTQA